MALALGLMSGTSCDGVSAALARFHGRTLQVIAEHTTPYPVALARRLRRGLALSAREVSALNMELGAHFARAACRLLRTAHVPARRVTVIGSHGHTIYHGPDDATPSTLQIGASAVIAQRTGIPVVADFRSRDLAAGGTGAPLIPFFDETFFGHGPARALQNIGGIANVTVVGRGIPTRAFDTGPGNCLIDLVVQQMSRKHLQYDAGGRLARRGRVDQRAIERLWRHPYFHRSPPKSTGRELFSNALLRQMFGARLSREAQDVLATVTYFTAYSIVGSYRRFVPHRLREVIISGGGARNRTLMGHLTRLLDPVPVRSIESYGIPLQAKEPLAFAYLALQTIRHRVNHLPQTTGAASACILGNLTPGNPA
ncbi:MAG: anhydro-N-acetylmuramic acid kinase [Candidatus Omnitrophica bacterium]|nr:anhydro-N-acetylmuramic acid kinase [Candidatus Omnitrophota bacterium]